MANQLGVVNITSNDTLLLNGIVNGVMVQQLFTTLSNKSTVVIEPPNDLVNVDIGKNGNAIFANIRKGELGDMELRPLMANVDHVFLNAQLAQWRANSAAYVLMNGSFTKVFGDGLGNIKRFAYTLNGGVVRRNVRAEENVEGEVDQAVAAFKLTFAQIVPIIT